MENQIGLLGGTKPLKMRWVMVSLAFLATVLNYVHRLSFNYLSADGDLRKLIPDHAFGYIGTAFFVAYMLSNAFSGFVIDKDLVRVLVTRCVWLSGRALDWFTLLPLRPCNLVSAGFSWVSAKPETGQPPSN